MIPASFRLGAFLVCALPFTAYAAQPANVGEAIMHAVAYHDSGAYKHDFDMIMNAARASLSKDVHGVRKPAIVLDIDETTLSNWPELRADGLGYIPNGTCDTLPKGPCGFNAWEASAQATAFPATKALISQAHDLNVAVFFVTGRQENDRDATERNLRADGISGWTALYLRPNGSHVSAEDYKTPVRASIEKQGYTIIENVGDQPSDLVGGYAKHTFLLPNPFYRIP